MSQIKCNHILAFKTSIVGSSAPEFWKCPTCGREFKRKPKWAGSEVA